MQLFMGLSMFCLLSSVVFWVAQSQIPRSAASSLIIWVRCCPYSTLHRVRVSLQGGVSKVIATYHDLLLHFTGGLHCTIVLQGRSSIN